MRVAATVLWALALVIGCISAASADGTLRVQQRDGSVKIYQNVRIAIDNETMTITSKDKKGSIVLGKAACTKLDVLVRCYPYDATLHQHGESQQIALASGTVWVNPGSSVEQLSHSTTQLPPRGVLMTVQTKAGTYVSLTGVVDEVKK